MQEEDRAWVTGVERKEEGKERREMSKRGASRNRTGQSNRKYDEKLISDITQDHSNCSSLPPMGSQSFYSLIIIMDDSSPRGDM
jgi:hypothetical protein